VTATRGDELKDEGMSLAAAAAAEWSAMARDCLEYLAARGTPFTSEDLVRLVGLPRGKVGSNRNNAVGAAISGAARRGLIVEVGRVNARRSPSHSARLTIWQGVPDA
jgi:hypothetical protein